MRTIKKAAAACMALLLAAGTPVLGPAPVTAYGAEAADVYTISSAEDLIQLSEECVFDTYSLGKVFELTADIDLTGKSFSPIASFGGTFQGNGHVISGLYLTLSGTDIGLFGRVESAGRVENLTVTGVILPKGSRKNVGGIAGINRGQIIGCTFGGRIQAADNTGGIAGYNEAGGLIEGCVNMAEILGQNATGGVAGYNEGIIEGCQNRGCVNTKEQKGKDSGDSQTALPGRILDAEKVYYTGGIAGRSTGTIADCSNTAGVGYLHSGYNTGGIAGMQNGCILRCTNSGNILGRKDTGGIVGQFEPYIRISYEEDTIQRVQNQIDVLLDQMDVLSTTVESAGDDTKDNVEALRSELKGIRSGVQSDKQYYSENTRKFSEDLSASLDDLSSSIDDFELKFSSRNMGGVNKELADANRKMKELREKLREALASDPRSAGDILDEMAEQLDHISRLVREMPDAAKDDVNHTTGEITDQAENIQAGIRDTRNIITINREKLFDDLDATGDDAEMRLDAVSESMDALFDRLGSAGDEVKAETAAIRNQMDVISDTIRGSVDDLKDERDAEFIDDISDSQPSELGNGMVLESANSGRVESDNNVGGITGIIGLELSMDPENDIDVEGEYSTKIARTARALVQACENRADVVTTNDYAGGIAGRADAGALNGNYNYGDVEAVNGGYVGGIAGSSANGARNNYVLCQLKGRDFVGGVTGRGEDVIGNYVMASIIGEEDGEYHGAVAGQADGQVSGNVMVWEGLPAVDGVTYASQATAVSYEEFTAMEGMPKEFTAFQVQFLVDGQIVREVTVPYGQPVPEEEIPEIPAKDGFYACWQENGQDRVIRNIRVNADYSLWTTTVASANGTQEDTPVLLAEGEFYPGTQLSVEETAVPEGIAIPGYTVKKAYQYEITSPKDGEWSLEGLRVLTAGMDAGRPLDAAVLDSSLYESQVSSGNAEGCASCAASYQDGSYLVFEASNPQGVFLVVEKDVNWYPAAAAAGLVLAVLAAVLVIRRRKKGKIEKQAGAGDEKDGEEK